SCATACVLASIALFQRTAFTCDGERLLLRSSGTTPDESDQCSIISKATKTESIHASIRTCSVSHPIPIRTTKRRTNNNRPFRPGGTSAAEFPLEATSY